MFHFDDLDVQRELSQIPPEYQDIFRQALERELAELAAGPDEHTDTDILRYLRRRRDDFRRGAFIRPDGRPGIVVADPEMLYEQGVMGLALGHEDEEMARERRRTRYKLGAFLVLVVFFLAFAVRGRAGRAGEEAVDETPVAAEDALVATPTLPEVSGAGDSLQTIGGLGAALTIGRPSAIELRYAATEEVIALAIDPSRPTPRGELRHDEATMASENPVAVWLFGTVVNYDIGLPDSLVRNLQPGDRIRLSTDTGASLAFIVTETHQRASHETAAVLSQNRPGMTLFALPAADDDDVALALAAYDVTAETGPAHTAFEVGERVSLAGWGEAVVKAVQYTHTADGTVRIVIEGENQLTANADGRSLMLSLAAADDQTPAVPLEPAEGPWEAAFTLPTPRLGLPLYAELRLLPAGELVVVTLGEIPDLQETLAVTVAGARLVSGKNQLVLHIDVSNPGEGAVYLPPDFIRLKGGDADEHSGQVRPGLPMLLAAGETLGLTVTFPLSVPVSAEPLRLEDVGSAPVPGQEVQLQIGAGLWAIGLPADTDGPEGP